MFNALAQELQTGAESPVDEDVNMRDDDRRDGFGGEEQVPMGDGEQRDGSVPEREVLPGQDVERSHSDSCAENVQHKLSSVAS